MALCLLQVSTCDPLTHASPYATCPRNISTGGEKGCGIHGENCSGTNQTAEKCGIGNGHRVRKDAGTHSDSLAVFGKEYSHLTTRERKELRELKLQRLRRCHPILYLTRPTLFGDNFQEIFPWGVGDLAAIEVRRHQCAKDQHKVDEH